MLSLPTLEASGVVADVLNPQVQRILFHCATTFSSVAMKNIASKLSNPSFCLYADWLKC
jgi:hypothetical protein